MVYVYPKGVKGKQEEKTGGVTEGFLQLSFNTYILLFLLFGDFVLIVFTNT